MDMKIKNESMRNGTGNEQGKRNMIMKLELNTTSEQNNMKTEHDNEHEICTMIMKMETKLGNEK